VNPLLDRFRHSRAALSLLAVLVAACNHSRSPTEPGGSGGGAANLSLELVTTHFDLHYSTASAGLMNAYANALEQNWLRISSDLGQSSLPRIEGFFYPDRNSFATATGFPEASGSVSGPNQFNVLAIPLALAIPVHEFAHNVTLHLAPTAGGNPVWLWEAVALYEAGQFVAPSSVSYLAAGDFPTLAQLNQPGGRYSIYDVGFTITEFIIREWGSQRLRALIVSHGNIEGTLGIATEEFERRWREYVATRYL